MTLWLTPEELIELTGYKQREKQKLALGKMGVHFRSREADGYPLVDRAQFEATGYRQLFRIPRFFAALRHAFAAVSEGVRNT